MGLAQKGACLFACVLSACAMCVLYGCSCASVRRAWGLYVGGEGVSLLRYLCAPARSLRECRGTACRLALSQPIPELTLHLSRTTTNRNTTQIRTRRRTAARTSTRVSTPTISSERAEARAPVARSGSAGGGASGTRAARTRRRRSRRSCCAAGSRTRCGGCGTF